MSSTRVPRAHTEVNLVPMIDVLLVLIIIFMLQQLTVIKFVLPTQNAPDPSSAADEIVLVIDAAGEYSLNGTPIAADSLEARLHAVFDLRSQKTLMIQPDRRVLYRQVTRAMDVAKGSGVEVLSLLANNP